MTFEESIAQFCRGVLAVDFHRVDISQTTDQDPIRLIGPGHIRQNEDGRLELKCYAKSAADVVGVGFEMFNQQWNRQSGEVFEAADYYDIEAHDISDYRWTTSPALIHQNWSMTLDAGTVTADLATVRRERSQISSTAILQLTFFEQEHRHWRALTAQSDILVADDAVRLSFDEAGDDRICVTARSEQDLSPTFEDWLLEALQFVLCRTLYPSIADEIRHDRRILELRSRVRFDRNVQAMPPLPTTNTQYQGDVATLLRAYFQHVADAGDEKLWHPLTSYLALARSTSSNLSDAWAIGLCIAIEGVSKDVAFEPNSSSSEHQRLRDGVKAWMRDQDFADNLQSRINGLLGTLDQVRPVDRLMSLIASGHVHSADIDNWKKLRNASVHTRRATEANLEKAYIQENIDRIYRALRLFYMLVFHQIGYAGPFTDYGERGWPEGRYPLNRLPADAPTASAR